MRIGLVSVLLVSVVLVVGCASSKHTIKSGGGHMLADTWKDSPITNVFIQTTGIGVADKKLSSKTQRRATSREAAIVQAQYEMLSTLKGVKIDGEITVKKAMEDDSRIVARVNDFLKGARVVKCEWLEDDSCVVTLQLDYKGKIAKRLGVARKSQY
ncbi:hypothetical protein HQ584_06360 [Patescibacteria group bacterium]|nr:hypothetical protein [Patescibacteria group bacterium]